MAFNPDASFTYYGKEAAELSLRPAMERAPLSRIFGIREGIKGKQLVRYLERVGLITVLDPGCGNTGAPLPIGRTSKVWDPKDLLAEVWECWKDARGTAEEWLLQPGNDKYKLDETTYGLTYAELVGSAAVEDLHRMAHFADASMVSTDLTASITMSNGVVRTAAQLLPYFKTFNGLWRNVELGVTAGQTKYVEISENATSGDQVFGPEDVYALFVEMFGKASPRLTGQATAQKQFLVTRSIFNAYEQYRESQNHTLAYTDLGNGVLAPTFRGVAIQVVDEWDEFIGQYFKPASLSGKLDRPHRAILTAKGNLQLGFDATPIDDNGGADLEVWSDRDTRYWKARLQYVADQQNADDSLIVAAY